MGGQEDLADEIAQVRETLARQEAAADALREADSRHEAAASDTIARHEALSGMVAALNEAVSQRGDDTELAQARRGRAGRDRDVARDRPDDFADRLDELRAAVVRHGLPCPRLYSLRDKLARQEAATTDLGALRGLVIDSASREDVERHEADIAALREALERQQAAAGDVAQLGDIVARQEAAAGEVAELREAVARQEAAAGRRRATRGCRAPGERCGRACRAA